MKPEHELFCIELVKHNFNQTAAYCAVYPNSSRAAAGRSAHLLLKKPEIRDRVNSLIEERVAAEGIAVSDIVRKLWQTASADPNELVEVRHGCCRYCWGDGNLYQYTPAEWDAVWERYLQDSDEAERDGRKPPREPSRRGGVGFDRRQPPNPICPECFGEGVEDVRVKDTRYLSPAALSLYAGAKVTKDGVEVKTHNRDKSLEMLGRYLAMFTDNVDHKNNGGSFEPMSLSDFYQTVGGKKGEE